MKTDHITLPLGINYIQCTTDFYHINFLNYNVYIIQIKFNKNYNNTNTKMYPYKSNGEVGGISGGF